MRPLIGRECLPDDSCYQTCDDEKKQQQTEPCMKGGHTKEENGVRNYKCTPSGGKGKKKIRLPRRNSTDDERLDVYCI